MRKPVAALVSFAMAVVLAVLLGPAAAFADPTIEEVELDAYDDFTVDIWTDPLDTATADGDAVSDAATRVKEQVLAAYDCCAESVSFGDTKNITVGDVRAGMALVYANAERYWAASRYSMKYYDADGDKVADNDEVANRITLFYVVDTADISAVKSATEAKITEARSWVDEEGMSDFEAAQAVHDYLVRTCVYNKSAAGLTKPTKAHTAYGVLVENSAVCQGYALAYKLLLNRLGIPCVFVVSKNMNHAWNLVQIGGEWYHVDVTWDDPVYSDGTDAGFDVDVSHNYFLRADTTMKNSLKHYGWEAVYSTPEADYAVRDYADYAGPVATSLAHTYAHSDLTTQGSLSLLVEWDDPVMGEPTTFHVSASGGSGSYKYYMAAPAYSSTGEWSFSSVPDPSRGEYAAYSDVCESKDFTFTMTASGTYFYKFYVMDMGSRPYTTLNSRTYVTVSDDEYPSVASIVSGAVAQAKAATDGSEYVMALWLHDWLLDQLEYDNTLTWASAEAALTRHMGTCQAYTNAYTKLLNAAGIENAETRDTYDGHTWNAVKLDGQWYQVDCTWDDNDDTKYYGFDARHLYFGLTDELMTVAHKGHAKIYTADGYATRSTSLADNYYVSSGLAAEWAGEYVARIQAKLDAREKSFSIASDNAYNPPSIIGIQNAVVAYAMGQRDWTTADGAEVGLTATANVVTESNSKWSAMYDFTATYAAIDASRAKVEATDQVWTGKALMPEVTVTFGNKTLVNGTDYTVKYENNTAVGTAKAAVTFKGNYKGAATGTFAVKPVDASKATVKVPDQTWTGSALTPTVTVKLGNKTLVSGTDYDVEYSNNTAVGTATVTVAFKGNYAGTASGTFKINAASISSASVTAGKQTYTGLPLTSDVTVKLGNKKLVNGTDYTVKYENNTAVGTAKVTVIGKGNCSGNKAATFTIDAADASGATVTAADQAWTGKALTPAAAVKLGSKTLTKGADYTVAYSNNTNAGTATITVTFKGNYAGKATGTFKITKKETVTRVTMTRLYNKWSGEHLYTSNAEEIKDLVGRSWKNEGTAWIAPSKSSTPVYRLYNPFSGDHHYTTSKKEYNDCGEAGWKQEGIAWYSDDAKGVPLYRGFNRFETVGTHHYTLDWSEMQTMVKNAWAYEGVAWYGLK